MVDEEVEAVGWLEEYAEVFKSEIIKSVKDVHRFVKRLDGFRADLLRVHIPVWTEPVLTATLARLTELPVVLLGNFRPETSSIVGIVGAGGALDQISLAHERVFDHRSDDAYRSFLAFIRAAVAVKRLKGQTLGIFGGRSLGMITATADLSQWQRVFGIDIDHVDQLAFGSIGKGRVRRTSRSTGPGTANKKLSGNKNNHGRERLRFCRGEMPARVEQRLCPPVCCPYAPERVL